MVAQLESFSRAADELYLSQPAVSVQIRQLEKELGVTLLDRVGPPTLTRAGRAVLSFAEAVEHDFDELNRRLTEIQSEQPFVSFGCSATSAKQFVPDLISELRTIAPDVHVRVTTLPPDEAQARLLKGELDFILTTEGFLSSRLASCPVSTARLFLVAQPSHPLVRRSRVSADEVSRYPFALLPAPWSAQAKVRAWARNQGVTIQGVMELSSYDGLKEAARKGLALAVVAESVLAGELERGELAIIQTPGLPIEYPIYLAHRAGPLGPHLEAVKTAALRVRPGPAARATPGPQKTGVRPGR